MQLFDVYPIFDIEPVKGTGCYLWDQQGTQYLDLYGGHAVISIGHSHPHYIHRISEQLNKIGFYSNSVQITIQQELAKKLGELSNKSEYQLFLCNSGAEANENALKLASFHNQKKKIIAFQGSFHGRTSLAVAATDNKKLIAPVNETENVIFLPFNNIETLQETFHQHEISSVIIEGVQGVGGIQIADADFLRAIRECCNQHNAVFIADSVQCGYGRTGTFFSHDQANVQADIYTLAKGMGNGFPVAGIMIAPHIKPQQGILGTTFGGNHLACAAAMAVLEVMEQNNLVANAHTMGEYLMQQIRNIQHPAIKEVRGKGLMVGVELEQGDEIRKRLLFEHHVFTGSANNKNVIRLLPALNITHNEINQFLEAFRACLAVQYA